MKIDAESLFARVYDELERRSGSTDIYETLSCARLLRQLLLDGLIDQANKHRRVKIRFLVTEDTTESSSAGQGEYRVLFTMIADGLDPSTSLKKRETISVKIDAFLSHKVIFIMGRDVSVLDILHFAAYRAGAVHFRNETIDYLNEGMTDNTLIYQLESICRVTLPALKPLRRECKAQF